MFKNLAKSHKVLARGIKQRKSDKSGDPKLACLGTKSLETTWKHAI